MLKGVNRQIVEVNCLENLYFERALLFVRPSATEFECEVGARAREAIEAMRLPEFKQTEQMRLGRMLRIKKARFYRKVFVAVCCLVSLALGVGTTLLIF